MTRETRAGQVATERRRRKNDTLDRINGLKLALPPEFATPEAQAKHHYVWANDVPGRLYDLTVNDDYDVVSKSGAEATDEDRVTRPVGTDEGGKPVYAVLVRKPMEFHLEDRKAKDQRLKDQEKALKRAPPKTEGLSEDLAYVASASINSGRYTP